MSKLKKCTDYDNIVLQKHQKKLVEFISKPDSKGILAFHSVGSGKCHARDELILMSDCSSKKVQLITIGDKLMGDDSKPRSVISLSRGIDSLYTVTNSDNEKYTVNKDHILCLKGPNFPLVHQDKIREYSTVYWITNNEIKMRKFKYFDSVEENIDAEKNIKDFINNIKSINEEIIEISVLCYLRLADELKNELFGYKVPLTFPGSKLNFNPYLLGRCIATNNNKIPNFLSGDITEIKIPNNFKFNNKTSRGHLLAGIIDGSEDTGDSKSYILSIKNNQLKKDTIFLARSLGISAYINIAGKVVLYGGNLHKIPVTTFRKKNTSHIDNLLYKISVTLVGYGEYFGFTLTGNNRYLIDNFTVTHNTITSLASAKCLMENFPLRHVQIITNASLTGNFLREIKNLKLNFKNQISVDSYGTFLSKAKKGKNTCRDTILIVDESQGLNGQGSSRFKWIFECAKEAPKVILLSATPVKNYPEDFANQLSLLTGERIGRSKIEALSTLNNKIKEKAYRNLLGCKVSYMKTNLDTDPNYPSIKHHVVLIKMTKTFYDKYLKIQENEKENIPEDFLRAKNLTVFYNGIRRAVNKLDIVSPKIDWAIDKIVKDISEDKKVLLYSNWLDSGITIIKKILKSKGINVSEVSGKLNKGDKDREVNKYNKGINKVILISSAGAEGLNLKETRTVIILEPHWNQSRIDQVIGRAVRYHSHSKLPENKKNVEVFHLVLQKNEKYIKFRDVLDSADLILLKLSQIKERNIQNFYDNLSKVSIENDPTCMK